jgi:histidinol phosphatase-like PHP family hydrolase
MTNADIAEQLAFEAGEATGHLRMALKRAARAAFLWPDEVSDLAERGAPLTSLPAVGPFIERTVLRWLDKPPPARDSSELRKNFLTLSEARRILSTRPGWASNYKGDLQMHSNWSDGSGSIDEMAQAAIERGYKYIAITDHSKGLKIAGGINESELEKQQQHIRGANEALQRSGQSFRVLRSVELNLNPQGQGDMDPLALKSLDLVVGAFHSALRQNADQTQRYIAALSNPSVNILGHPRGRIYNHRAGLNADWSRVFANAAKLDKAIEVDSYPDRQDIDIMLLKVARKEGVRIAVDTDAHSPGQLAFIELGLAAVLQARIPSERIINFMPANQLLEWARAGRG